MLAAVGSVADRLADCRHQFASHLGASDLEWESDNEPKSDARAAVGQTPQDIGEPTGSDALQDAPSIEFEPELEPDLDNWPEGRARGRVGK